MTFKTGGELIHPYSVYDEPIDKDNETYFEIMEYFYQSNETYATTMRITFNNARRSLTPKYSPCPILVRSVEKRPSSYRTEKTSEAACLCPWQTPIIV